MDNNGFCAGIYVTVANNFYIHCSMSGAQYGGKILISENGLVADLNSRKSERNKDSAVDKEEKSEEENNDEEPNEALDTHDDTVDGEAKRTIGRGTEREREGKR